MKTSLSQLFLFLAATFWLAILPSCKEKNDEYPPRKWYEVSYEGNEILLRDISAIFYENEHSLWLGSKGTEGLLYFDGYKWIAYNKANTGIDFDSVTSFARDGNGKLWVGYKSGLAMLDGGKWMNIEAFDGLRVTAVVVEGIGRIRVGIKGASGGIATLQGNSWNFETPANSAIPSQNINAMVSDNAQVLWVATSDKGIIRLKNSEWESVSNTLAPMSENFTAIAKSTDGSIWAASQASELIHFVDDSCILLTTGASKPISSVVITGDYYVWSSTTGSGLIQFDGKTWTSYTSGNTAAMPSDEISCMSEGSPGYLFFSVPGGKFYTINY